MEILIILSVLLGIIYGLLKPVQVYTKVGYVKKEVKEIKDTEDPRISEAIQTLRTLGFSAKDAKKYVQVALENGCEDLVQGALLEVKI